jgi:hypothetical protein
MGAPDLTKTDRLKGLLEDWASWMHAYRPDLGQRGMSLVKSSGSHDFESLFANVEKEVMRAIDAAIDDLPPAQSAAIHKRYLHIEWRFPRDNYVFMLESAHGALLVSLPRRNVVL